MPSLKSSGGVFYLKDDAAAGPLSLLRALPSPYSSKGNRVVLVATNIRGETRVVGLSYVDEVTADQTVLDAITFAKKELLTCRPINVKAARRRLSGGHT